MELFGLVKLSLTDRTRLLEAIKAEEWSGTLAFLAIIFGWYVIITAPFFILQRYLTESVVPLKEYLAVMPVSYALIFVMWIAWLFIWGGVVHAFVAMFGGKGQYKDTFKAITYGLAPVFIIGSLLFYLRLINPKFYLAVVLVYVFTLYLIIKGISKLHNTKFLTAFAAYMIPFTALLAALLWFASKTDLLKILGI